MGQLQRHGKELNRFLKDCQHLRKKVLGLHLCLINGAVVLHLLILYLKGNDILNIFISVYIFTHVCIFSVYIIFISHLPNYLMFVSLCI